MGSNLSKSPSGISSHNGNGNNSSNNIRKTSSSASFGRLAIGSPASYRSPGSNRSHTLSQRRKMRRQQQQHGSYQSFVGIVAGAAAVTATGISSANASPSVGQSQSLPHKSLSDDFVRESSRLLSKHHHSHRMDDDDEYDVSVGSPPIIVWIFPALCCALAYALYNIFIKKGSASINPVLGGVILQLVAAILGMILLGVLISKEGTEDILVYDSAGIRWAILAGISVGTAEIVSFFVSSLGVQAMQSIPVIIGGSVMFGTTIGSIFLHEELTYRGWFGVILISCGISLVGLDDAGGAAA